MTLQLISSVKSLQSVFPSHLREDDLGLLVSLTDLSSPGLQGDAESVIAGELMTGAGGEREDRGVGACSNNHITSSTSLARPDPTSATDGVIADGPLEVTDS